MNFSSQFIHIFLCNHPYDNKLMGLSVELAFPLFVYIIASLISPVVFSGREESKLGGDLDSTWVKKPKVHAELQYSS